MASAWRNFKNIFSRPLFTVIFRPEMLKFHPYSILTGQTMVGFVMYFVLKINPNLPLLAVVHRLFLVSIWHFAIFPGNNHSQFHCSVPAGSNYCRKTARTPGRAPGPSLIHRLTIPQPKSIFA